MKGIISYIGKDHGYIRYGTGQTVRFQKDHVSDIYGFENLSRDSWVEFELVDGARSFALDVKRMIQQS